VLTRRSFFRRLLANQEAREFLMNSLAVGEADSALDLDRVAEHVQDEVLSRRIYRHHAEEKRHARLFGKRLADLGFAPHPLPEELDYERYAQRFGMGTPKARLDDPRAFDEDDIILFFAGSKAGEERACAEMQGLIGALSEDPETVALLRTIHADEVRHVSYATEELQRLSALGKREKVLEQLRAARRAEARAHRLVSRAFMGHLMRMLDYPRWVQFFAGIQIDLMFGLRWLFPGGLDQPIIANAMPIPADRFASSSTTAPESAR
jgi:hypothetical protein